MILILTLPISTHLIFEDCKKVTHYGIFAVKISHSMVLYGYTIKELS